jgi:hypothetical protein
MDIWFKISILECSNGCHSRDLQNPNSAYMQKLASMDHSSDTDQSRLGFLNKEYMRLSERCVSYVDSSLGDIKLFGIIGSFISLPVIANKLFDNNIKIVFYGFLTIFTIFIVLSVYVLIKQVLVVYYLDKLALYEEEIRKLINDDNNIFEWARSYKTLRQRKVANIYSHLLLVTLLVLIVFPLIVLFGSKDGEKLAWIYLGVSVFYISIFISAFRRTLY